MPRERIQNIIKEILNRAGFFVDEIFFDNSEESIIFISIKSSDGYFLIGKNGETLSSLNYLVSKILEKEMRGQDIPYFIIDVNNFKRKKIESLRTTAHMLAERAKYFKSDISVDPMPAYDRKIIHSYLQNVKNIKTESVGLGKERHIVIKYQEE